MKQRLVVMNGQRIIQSQLDGSSTFDQAKNDVIGKAGSLKPGIHNLFSAVIADKSEGYEGQILHASKESVFQKTGAKIVEHARVDFEKVPEIGSNQRIQYDDQAKAVVTASAIKLGRGLSR